MFYKLLKEEIKRRLNIIVKDKVEEYNFKRVRVKTVDTTLENIFKNHQMQEIIKDYDNRYYVYLNDNIQYYKYEYTCKTCGLKIYSKSKIEESGETWKLESDGFVPRIFISNVVSWIYDYPDNWDSERRVESKNCYSNEEWKKLRIIKGILD